MLTIMNAQSAPAALALEVPRFPLPKRHRRFIACAAVAASVALGSLGVAATVETVQHGTTATASR
jgi:hypothetical protein